MRISDWSSDVCSSDLADGFDLRVADAQQGHHAAHSVGAALAQGQIVFGAAAFVSVALDLHALLLVRSQVAGVGFNQIAVLVGHGVAVEIEIHRARSEEHTSELQSLMRLSYAVFCLT